MAIPLIPEEQTGSALDLIHEQQDIIDTLQASVIVLRGMRDQAQSKLRAMIRQNDAALARIAALNQQLAAAKAGPSVNAGKELPEVHQGDPLPRGMRLGGGFRIV